MVADLHVAVSNKKPLSFVMGRSEWDPFALFPNYKIFPTVACNIKAPRSSRKVPDMPVRL